MTYEDRKKAKITMLKDLLIYDIDDYANGDITKEQLYEKIQTYNDVLERVRLTGSFY